MSINGQCRKYCGSFQEIDDCMSNLLQLQWHGNLHFICKLMRAFSSIIYLNKSMMCGRIQSTTLMPGVLELFSNLNETAAVVTVLPQKKKKNSSKLC